MLAAAFAGMAVGDGGGGGGAGGSATDALKSETYTMNWLGWDWASLEPWMGWAGMGGRGCLGWALPRESRIQLIACCIYVVSNLLFILSLALAMCSSNRRICVLKLQQKD
jgi:hypothetical protein